MSVLTLAAVEAVLRSPQFCSFDGWTQGYVDEILAALQSPTCPHCGSAECKQANYDKPSKSMCKGPYKEGPPTDLNVKVHPDGTVSFDKKKLMAMSFADCVRSLDTASPRLTPEQVTALRTEGELLRQEIARRVAPMTRGPFNAPNVGPSIIVRLEGLAPRTPDDVAPDEAPTKWPSDTAEPEHDATSCPWCECSFGQCSHWENSTGVCCCPGCEHPAPTGEKEDPCPSCDGVGETQVVECGGPTHGPYDGEDNQGCGCEFVLCVACQGSGRAKP